MNPSTATPSRPRRRHGKINDPQTITRLIEAVAAGDYIEVACAHAGIGKTTYYEWVKKAEQGRKPYVAVIARVADAEAQAEHAIVKAWHAVATDVEHPKYDWRAGRDLLARRHAATWGERVAIDLKTASDREIEELSRQLAELDSTATPSAARELGSGADLAPASRGAATSGAQPLAE